MDLQLGTPPRQGAVGDCWLISILETLWANWPGVLKNMLTPLGNGQVEVRINVGVFWINSHFPPHMAQPLWAALLEKAVSIYLGGYSRLNGNTIRFACELLLSRFELLHIPNSISIIPTARGFHALHPDQSFVL